MSDSKELIRGACRDLSDALPGLEVVDRPEYDLRITDPLLAMKLQPLSRDSVNDVPRPPNPFSAKGSFIGERPTPLPWLAPTREYTERYVEPFDEFVVAFDDYGKVSTQAQSGTHRRRARRRVEERQEAFAELDIEPERQLVITIDGLVRESIAHRLMAYYLATQGWLVSTDFLYIPGGLGGGVPDIVAWKSPLLEALYEAGLVEDGAMLDMLAYPHLLDRASDGVAASRSAELTTETLVAEVKGEDRGVGDATNQLKKYLRWNAFDYGYWAVPDYRGARDEKAGTLTFDADGFEFIPAAASHATEGPKVRFVEIMDTAAKHALICGLPLNDLLELAAAAGAAPMQTPHELVKRLRDLDNETVIDAVMA